MVLVRPVRGATALGEIVEPLAVELLDLLGDGEDLQGVGGATQVRRGGRDPHDYRVPLDAGPITLEGELELQGLPLGIFGRALHLQVTVGHFLEGPKLHAVLVPQRDGHGDAYGHGSPKGMARGRRRR